jgi:hypothetical protein
MSMWLGWRDKECLQTFHREGSWRTRNRCEDNIKFLLTELGSEDGRWLELAQVFAVLHLRVLLLHS